MIDGHLHFFDPDRIEGLAWPAANSPLMRTSLPANFLDEIGEKTMDGVIAVETSRRFSDDVWLLELAQTESLIRGVVLNLQPDKPEFEKRLAVARRNPKFCGIRMRPIVDYDLASVRLRRSLGSLSDAGYTVELGAESATLKVEFSDLADEFRNSHWILNHAGHPDLSRSGPSTDWIDSMKRLARRSNVLVKVTNPFGYMAIKEYPHIDVACGILMKCLTNLFGADRLIFGSNWPVCTQSASFERVVKCLEESLRSDSQRESIFCLNVLHAYGLASK